MLAVVLAAAIPFPSRLSLPSEHAAERHLFVEYVVTYIAIGLFLICLRRFHVSRTKEFLFLGLGCLTFVTFQVLQNIAVAGFHGVAWLTPSLNRAVAFDISARLSFSLFFLLAVLNINLPLAQPSIRTTLLIYLNVLTVVLFGGLLIFIFSPPILMVQDHATLLKKGLDLFSAGLLLAAFALLFRQFWKNPQTIYFWFLTAALFGLYSSIYSSLWSLISDIYFDAGQALKILYFSVFLVGLFAEHVRSLKTESELRQSLEKYRTDLEKSEKTFRQFLDNMADGFIVTDKNGQLIFSNQAFTAMLNYERDQLLGQSVSFFLPGKINDAKALESFILKNAAAGEQEVELVSSGGNKIPALLRVAAVTETNGEFGGMQCVVTNLTERKKIERNLENLVKEKTKHIEIFQQCIENSTDGILITELEGKITYCNRAFLAISGFSKSDILGKNPTLLIIDQRSEHAYEQIWKTVLEGRVWHGEFHTRRKDGSGFIGELSVVPINDERGATVNLLWIESDITRRKMLERSLQRYAEELTSKTSELEAAKSYYETLISGMTDILIVVDRDGECTFINDYGIKRLKLQAQDLTKDKLPIFFDDLKRLEKDYGRTIRVEIKDFESVIKVRDGETILCSWHARPLFDRNGRRVGAMAVGRDITEYKKMQNQLQEYTKNLENKVEERTRELQQKVNQLAKLLEIGEEIRLNVDIDVILNKICEAVQALGWRRVVISLRDYELRSSRPVAAAGLQPAQVAEVMSWGAIPFEHTQRYLKEEYRISNSFFIGRESKVTKPNTPHSVYVDLGERGPGEWHALDALLVPIRTKDKILGLISVDDPEDRKRPSLEKIRDLEIFADKAALAIENARLFQVQKENERQNKFLAEISQIFHSSLKMSEVLEAVVHKGGIAIGEFCSILLLDEQRQRLIPHSTFHEKPHLVELFLQGCEQFPCQVGEGIVGEVAASSRPLLVSKPFPDEIHGFARTPFVLLNQEYPISSLMILPLRVRDRLIGVMIYLFCQPKRKFKNDELKLAQELAERAALAIENARLFEETGEKAHELEKANQLKSEFLASVSHELRTPLNAIITLSDILVRGLSGGLNAEQIKQMQIIQRSGTNLLNLINDILDLSKIEAGKIEPLYSRIPIRSMVEETVEHIRPLCIQKGLSLEFECDPEVPEFIYSDQDKLTKALMNVIGNAVKFTLHGGISIKIGLTNESQLKIIVADTGIGIPSDRIGEIFEEFRQLDSSDSRTYGGTGLGLAITRKVLTIIGGSISVESQLEKGSSFTIFLPLFTDHELQGKKIIAFQPELPKRPAPQFESRIADDRDRLDGQKKLVLVIEDDQDARYIMQQYLRDHNYQVVFPQNGEDVIALAERVQPFAITLDLLMPDRSGWEVLELLRTESRTKGIPIIITSILAEQERAYEMGATEYLVKPFEPQKLLVLLATLEARSKKKKAVLDLPSWLSFQKRAFKRLFSLPRHGGERIGYKSTILLVDDDKDTQYAVRYILEEAGHKVYFANEGHEAIQCAEAFKPNLILMDIMMPKMDGYEATRRLKANDELKNIPIIAMTAKAMKGDREKIILAGCDDYISKPFMTKDILNLVEKWLEENRLN
jgi:PAS domain S-box-containing protein